MSTLHGFHGEFADGYTDDDIDALAAAVAAETGGKYTLICLWDTYDAHGFGGDSVVLIHDRTGWYEVSLPMAEFLEGGRDTLPAPADWIADKAVKFRAAHTEGANAARKKDSGVVEHRVVVTTAEGSYIARTAGSPEACRLPLVTVGGEVQVEVDGEHAPAGGELSALLRLPADAQRMVTVVLYAEGTVATLIHGGRMLAVSVSDADTVYVALYRGGKVMVPPAQYRGGELVASVLGSEDVLTGCDDAMRRAVEKARTAQEAL